MRTLLGPVLAHLPHATAAYLTGRAFFPRLISSPFIGGLRTAFDFAAAACAVEAIASWLRGGRYYYTEPEPASLTGPAASSSPSASGPGASPPQAQSDARERTVTGTVREATSGAPVEGAAVTATDTAGQVTARVVTGTGGGYRLPGLSPGSYTVAASAAGCQPATWRVELNGADRVVDLPITREA
jgi:hypothetical protein